MIELIGLIVVLLIFCTICFIGALDIMEGINEIENVDK